MALARMAPVPLVITLVAILQHPTNSPKCGIPSGGLCIQNTAYIPSDHVRWEDNS